MSEREIVVLKFGSSVATDDEALGPVAAEARREVEEGRKVVAVVSALGSTTDRLDREARALSLEPWDDAYAALLETGELQAAAKLALKLQDEELRTTLLSADQLRLRTAGPRLDARPVSVNAGALLRAFDTCDVVVAPGFVGRSLDGRTTLLGRGGSDLTALFIARTLTAACRLVKDVDGWFVEDPALGGSVERYETLNWHDAAELDAPIVQPKAASWAAHNRQAFHVAALGSDGGTHVCAEPTRAAPYAGASEGEAAQPACVTCR